MNRYIIFTVFIFILTQIEGYKILGVFTYCGHSHFQLGFRLLKELADRGHNVTMISCYPQTEPIKNYKDISVAETETSVDEITTKFEDFDKLSFWGILQLGLYVSSVYTKNVLHTKAVQDLMNSDETFDLVIQEVMVNDAMTIFHHRFNCPLVLLASIRPSLYNNYLIGNIPPVTYTPNLMSGYGTDMNFWQRLKNIYYHIIGEIYTNFYHIPEHARILKETFVDAPDLNTFLYNASLMLTNSDVSLNDPVPVQENIKEIGGFHIRLPKPLPKNIQHFLDNATDGAILFSMGSIVDSDNFNPETKKAFLNVFSKIKQKVIWKLTTDIPEKPENVMIMDWLPQQDILNHSNTIGFISHGGINSIIEAVYYGVPILGMPVFWDQQTNIEDAVRNGIAIKLDLNDLNEESFGKSLKELIDNPKYKKNARERSKIMRDRPVPQIDEAVFWVEYVIRHKGAPYLKAAGLQLRWYQLYLIDVILFVMGILITVTICIKRIVKFIRKKYNPKIKTT